MSDRTSSLWLAFLASLVGASLLAGKPDSPPENPKEQKRASLAAKTSTACLAEIDSGSFIIATVPDPIDTGAGWMFDGFIDAIQRGFERRGYILERHRLPWTDPKPNHHHEPGMLVFASGKQRQAVLLVGETPTGGVHPAAFARALSIIDSARGSPAQRLRILGPAFSGSARSMKGLLTENSTRALQIVSGSATGASVDEVFGTDFTRMNLADDRVLAWLFEYLSSNASSWAHSRIALLVESNTGYGDQIKKIVTSSTLVHPILVPYSMQIGEVRRAYGDQKSSSKPQQLKDATAEQRLSAKDTRKPIDVPPILVPEMTVPGIEASLRIAAEDSIALHVSLFVREMYVHLFAHLAAVIASIVSLVLAVTIFPFQAQRLMLTAAFVVAAISMAVISWALIGMERDNILSRLAGSTPGKISWTPSFIGKLLAHVGAPVLVLMASQFPSVRILISELLGVVSLVVR